MILSAHLGPRSTPSSSSALPIFFLLLLIYLMRSILSPTHTSPAARSPAPAARGNVRVRTAADKMSGIVFEPFNEVRMRRGEGKEQRPPGHTSKKREKKKNAPPLHLPTPSHTGQARAGRRVQGRRDHRLPGAVRLHGRVRGGPQRADQVSGEARRAVGWGWVGEHTAPMRSPPPLDTHFPNPTHPSPLSASSTTSPTSTTRWPPSSPGE